MTAARIPTTRPAVRLNTFPVEIHTHMVDKLNEPELQFQATSLRSRPRQGSRRSFRTCRRIWRVQRHDEAP